MAERQVEKKYVDKIKAKGGICIKLLACSMTGLPDRLCLLPGARIWFCEFKFGRGKLSARQVAVKGILERLGFEVKVINEVNVDEEIQKI